jgi:hypothetical protein
MRKRRKARQRNANAKAIAKPQYRQRIKPNHKRSILFDGFTSGELRKLLEREE